jgi:hypothetical protein
VDRSILTNRHVRVQIAARPIRAELPIAIA